MEADLSFCRLLDAEIRSLPNATNVGIWIVHHFGYGAFRNDSPRITAKAYEFFGIKIFIA